MQNPQILIDIMTEGFVHHAKDGSIVRCNKAAEKILGLSFDQMIGRTSIDESWKTFHEDGSDFPVENHPAMITLKTGEEQRNVMMGVRKTDKQLVWIHINTHPFTKTMN